MLYIAVLTMSNIKKNQQLLHQKTQTTNLQLSNSLHKNEQPPVMVLLLRYVQSFRHNIGTGRTSRRTEVV